MIDEFKAPFAVVEGFLSKGEEPVTDWEEAKMAIAKIFEVEKTVDAVDPNIGAYKVEVTLAELGRIGHFEKRQIWFEDPEGDEYQFLAAI